MYQAVVSVLVLQVHITRNLTVFSELSLNLFPRAAFKQTDPPLPVPLSSCLYKLAGFSQNSVTTIQSIHITLRL